MKTKNAFTLIELIVAMVILAMLVAILLPVLSKVKQKSQQKQQTYEQESTSSSNTSVYQLGDTVIVDGMDITGRVNAVYGNGVIDLIVKNTNGTVITIERINGALLKKVPAPWR